MSHVKQSDSAFLQSLQPNNEPTGLKPVVVQLTLGDLNPRPGGTSLQPLIGKRLFDFRTGSYIQSIATPVSAASSSRRAASSVPMRTPLSR